MKTIYDQDGKRIGIHEDMTFEINYKYETSWQLDSDYRWVPIRTRGSAPDNIDITLIGVKLNDGVDIQTLIKVHIDEPIEFKNVDLYVRAYMNDTIELVGEAFL